jgi:hypothetical protein
MNFAIFWDITPCSQYVNRRFGENHHLSSGYIPAARWFLTRLILDAEDSGDIFPRNVGSHTDYTVLYPGRLYIKKPFCFYMITD